VQFRFGDHLLDAERRELRRGGQLVETEPQVFDLLLHLIRNRDRVVSKDDLIATVWRGRIVSDTTIDSRIKAARQAIGDSGATQALIGTLPRKGVRFIGAVEEESEPPSIVASATALLPLPDKPSIAVLSFTNMSSDPEQEFLADGIAEDVISALARLPSLFVIARNSAFTYRGRATDVKQVGRELGVRYVLEGSLRKSGERIRVTGQLVEAETGNHVWAERYDRDLVDIFAVQDEISQAVAIAIAPAVADAEVYRALRRPPANLDAWAAYQRGLWHMSCASAEDNAAAETFFQQAIEIDPNFSGGYKGLALAVNNSASVYGTRSPHEGFSAAEALARRAVALDSTDAEARARLGMTLWMRGDFAGALAEVERALALSANLAYAHGIRGSTLVFSGSPEEGVAALSTAIRLDPRDPNLAARVNHTACGLYLCGRYEEAIEVAKRGIYSYPKHPMCYRWLAAAFGQLGRRPEAEAALRQAIDIAPASFATFVRGDLAWVHPEVHASCLDGLRKAGFVENR